MPPRFRRRRKNTAKAATKAPAKALPIPIAAETAGLVGPTMGLPVPVFDAWAETSVLVFFVDDAIVLVVFSGVVLNEEEDSRDEEDDVVA